jgi:hypothetical protein
LQMEQQAADLTAGVSGAHGKRVRNADEAPCRSSP